MVGGDWPVLQSTPTSDDGVSVWVAADESGATGENLLDRQSIIAHAAVTIDDLTADGVLADLRKRAGAVRAPEAKFAHFTRDRAARALAETLAPDGPLAGRVNIVVAEKRYLAVGKMVDLLIEEWAHEHDIDLYRTGAARRMARDFFRDGPRGLGEQWEPLLSAFVSLARATQRRGPRRTFRRSTNGWRPRNGVVTGGLSSRSWRCCSRHARMRRNWSPGLTEAMA
jgi:hypothetical protein